MKYNLRVKKVHNINIKSPAFQKSMVLSWGWGSQKNENVCPCNLTLVLLFVNTEVECEKTLKDQQYYYLYILQ